DILAGWAAELLAAERKAVDEHRRAAADSRRRATGLAGEIDGRLAVAGLEPGNRDRRDVCFEAVTAARRQLRDIEEGIERAKELRRRIEAAQDEAQLTRTMGRHLSATGFEAWLLEEALAVLVASANQLLADLSSGAYSLVMVNRDFVVVDHRNADERRPVRTLSGGETFLVSLALALSLADQLAAMSVHGAARVESIFLDEGFGTLDAETLDTVAAVIHELGASGRTVGLVTHVRELADQMPVRFVVTKDAGSARVERVEA
ncbi:MAG: SbcC/MukB-like Walker B domain-containing protein, partial [Acidimicrobiia bacterium]